MKEIHLLAVGKLKTPHWQDAARHYAGRLSRTVRITETLVRDADPRLSIRARQEDETGRLLTRLRPCDLPVCLDERGTALSSEAFSALLRRIRESSRVPCFLLGGAYGLAPTARERAAHTLSFGPMTFPHELARVLLLEQVYRSEQIRANTGYHH